MSKKIFNRVGSLRPGKSAFDLSYAKTFNCDMGQLVPVMHDEVYAGDIFKISNEIVIRMQPMVAPILHEINAIVHYFFVPFRILDPEWEDFITGGVDGNNTYELPRWLGDGTINVKYSLWDYLGFPIDIIHTGIGTMAPLSYVKWAYNMIWNEWYRDETLQSEVDIDTEERTTLAFRNWEKDYFTSCLVSQQRGTPIALPISGTTSAVWDAGQFSTGTPNAVGWQSGGASSVMLTYNAQQQSNAQAFFAANTVDLSVATTFDVADLRLAFQIQKWQERNNRAGARYTEFLRAHFGVSPRDDRLDRPEYIGGTKQSVIVSEVLQTSSTDVTTPQGNLAGHGLTAAGNYVGKYHVQEPGIIYGLLSIMPRSSYSQGINRQWLRATRFDYYSPEFANLSEQAVYRAEIYADGDDGHDTTIFGYQGRYDEMRTKQDLYCADMRDSVLNYWHLGRIFGSAPSLNSSFIECNPSKRIFAVQDEPGFLVHFGNLIKAVRPMPAMSEPGLIDHN